MPPRGDTNGHHSGVIRTAPGNASAHTHATRIGDSQPDFGLLTRNHLQCAALKVPVNLHRCARAENRGAQRRLGRVDAVEVASRQHHQVSSEPLVFAHGGYGRLRQRQCGRVFAQPHARRILPRQQREKALPSTLLHASPPYHARLPVRNRGLQRFRHADLSRIPDTHSAAIRQRVPRALSLPQHLHLQFLAVRAE